MGRRTEISGGFSPVYDGEKVDENGVFPFFRFVLTTITLVSSIFLFLENRKLDKKSSYFLIPYMLFNICNWNT